MRNLKKTLCLVLALVFVLGLCTVGAVNGTEFSDQDEIQYETAVKAMSGLGILIGNDDNGDGVAEYRPTDKVTRAEAAKMIAYMMLGLDADNYPKLKVFDDVDTTHWAAGYIAYCQHNGIIAGYGNGKFGPNDSVTQAQYTKMLLAAAGFGAKGELEGASWDQTAAKLAMQNKILKNLTNVEWDQPATREETALLTFNTMMDVPQVVLSKDTDDYVWKTVNGNTFANSTWDLITVKGVVSGNKANTVNAKGTTISYRSSTGITRITVETEDDEDATILGHEVTVMYRAEGIYPNVKNVAYYIDDSCKEVTGAEANTAEFADLVDSVDNGNVAVNAMFEPYGKNTRIYDADGIYVLNAEGKLVSYKTSSYYVAVLSIDPLTGIASVTDDAGTFGVALETNIPKGAKNGDLVTVYQCGDIFTSVLCTKVEKVAIEQAEVKSFLDATYTRQYYFSYNNGQYIFSEAVDTAVMPTVLSSVNAFAIDYTALKPDLGDELKVGYSYTLYLDAEGYLFGYSDEVLIAEAAMGAYYVFIDSFGPLKDTYGNNVYYYQLVDATGAEKNVLAPDPANIPGALAMPGQYDVVQISTYTATTEAADGFAAGDAVGTTRLKIVTPPAADGDDGAFDYVNYDPTDPTYDFSKAKFVFIGTGTLSDLKQAAGGTPKLTSLDATSKISFSCRKVKVGTVSIYRVDTVWYTVKAAAASTNEKNSYIYVVSNDVKEEKLVGEVTIPFYNGYKDGAAMSDLRLAVGKPAPAVGFYQYTAKDGIYTLTPVGYADGTVTGARSVYLQNGDTNNFILENKTLYVSDGTHKNAIDLTDVKIVRIANTADAAALRTTAINSPAAIQAVLLNKDVTNYKVQISFVEVIDPITGVHSVGGGVIYVCYAGT